MAVFANVLASYGAQVVPHAIWWLPGGHNVVPDGPRALPGGCQVVLGREKNVLES